MRTGIFIASHEPDFAFLEVCVKSIARFCHGFHRLSIAVPNRDKPTLLRLLAKWGLPNGENKLNALVWTQRPSIPDGFMRAQHAMMCMDEYLWDCDQYMLLGSDSMFWDDVTPEHYMIDGKMVMLAQPLEMLKDNPTMCWVPGTERATGSKPIHDYMRSLPLFYNQRVLIHARAAVSRATGMRLDQYLQKRHKDFSESNIMGHVAWNECREVYHWVHDKLPFPTNLIQFWSHGGLDRPSDRAQFYNDKFGKTKSTAKRTPREVIIDVFGEDFYGAQTQGHKH